MIETSNNNKKAAKARTNLPIANRLPCASSLGKMLLQNLRQGLRYEIYCLTYL